MNAGGGRPGGGSPGTGAGFEAGMGVEAGTGSASEAAAGSAVGTDPGSPVARRIRARRRIVDAARLLPFLGAALFLAPDPILAGGVRAGATLPWGLYLFGAWALLIALAVWVARAHRREGG